MEPLETIPPTPPANRVLLTASEHAERRAELARLVGMRDRDGRELLRAARGLVAADAAEEMAQIHEEQTVLDVRIARLEELLASATIISDDQAADVVTVGSVVEVEYVRSGRRATYRVTGAGTGSGAGSVSARSPVGRAVMGRRLGDLVSAELPGGRVEQLRIAALGPGELPAAAAG